MSSSLIGVKVRHGKSYDVEQDTIQRANFERMDTEIRVHNRRFESGLETFSMEHNAFSDLVKVCLPPDVVTHLH
jgi:Cathepsin propeptide inhibitor domain (I29)